MAEELENPFTPADFLRMDEKDDKLFYGEPRLVVHIDDQAIDAAGQLFREVVPPNSVVLDLMSSWRSHWPEGHPKARMVGLGLNAVEMRENPELSDYVVHDLNSDPRLPFEDATFDAVLLTVSVQYIIKPIEVFRDVNRILKPGGPFVVVFSNRMFYDKATLVWRMSDDGGRMRLVESYFGHAGNYEEIEGMYRNPGRYSMEDPVYAVIGRKASG